MKQDAGNPNDSGETGEAFIASMRIRKGKNERWVDHPVKIVNAKEGLLSFDTSKIYPTGFTYYEILLNEKPVISGKIIRVKKPKKRERKKLPKWHKMF